MANDIIIRSDKAWNIRVNDPGSRYNLSFETDAVVEHKNGAFRPILKVSTKGNIDPKDIIMLIDDEEKSITISVKENKDNPIEEEEKIARRPFYETPNDIIEIYPKGQENSENQFIVDEYFRDPDGTKRIVAPFFGRIKFIDYIGYDKSKKYDEIIFEIPFYNNEYEDSLLRFEDNTITKVRSGFLRKQKGLTFIRLENLKTAGSDLVSDCHDLEVAVFPSLKRAGSMLLAEATSLTTAHLPNLKRTGDYSFFHCTTLESIALPNLEIGGNSLLEHCPNLKTVDLGHLQSADKYLLNDCHNLESCTIHSSQPPEIDGCEAVEPLNGKCVLRVHYYHLKAYQNNRFFNTLFGGRIVGFK